MARNLEEVMGKEDADRVRWIVKVFRGKIIEVKE